MEKNSTFYPVRKGSVPKGGHEGFLNEWFGRGLLLKKGIGGESDGNKNVNRNYGSIGPGGKNKY